ncbi:hypothetical protein ACFQ0M_03310 [Kitasatospora aburaviensis]
MRVGVGVGVSPGHGGSSGVLGGRGTRRPAPPATSPARCVPHPATSTAIAATAAGTPTRIPAP